MSRVVGIHQLTLKEGIASEAFEKFFKEEFIVLGADLSGVKSSLFKGDKGNREGEYMMLVEFESVETRDRLFPRSGEVPKEAQSSFRIFDYVSSDWTDYVEI